MKAVVPASQLLVYRVGEGWERLCQFLEVEVPHTNFPHENKAGQAGNIIDKTHRFDIYQQTLREARRSLLTAGLSLSLTVLGGFYLKKCLKF